MISFRWRISSAITLSPTTFSLISKPFFMLLFLFFFTSSTDLLHVPFIFFKIKLTNFVALAFGILFLLTFRSTVTPLKIFGIFSFIFANMLLSMMNSPNYVACIGFALFFLFNYLFYFSTTYNSFRFISSDILFAIYLKSFWLMGLYALCQVLFSFGGIYLPGVGQFILSLARGQGFTYEPSYYALYMTPYTMFCNTKFLLQTPKERKLKDIFWPNFLFLISTSTGCFFSYLFFIFSIALFKLFKIFKNFKVSISKLAFKICASLSLTFILTWFLKKELIISAFLKFFYLGFSNHSSATLRWQGIVDYWDMFLDNPWFGVGLGAGPFYLFQKKISPGTIIDAADLRGVYQEYCPTNVTTEILAGLGILGGILFFLLLYLLWRSFRSTLRISQLTSQEQIHLIALAVSLCVMFATLQFSQSIMRSYIWIHIGFFMGYVQSLRQKYLKRS